MGKKVDGVSNRSLSFRPFFVCGRDWLKRHSAVEVGNRSDGSIPSRHRFVSRRLQAAVHLSGSRLKVDQSQQSASFPSQWKRPVRLPHPQPCRLNRSQLLTSSYLSKLCPSGVECSCCPTSEQKSCHSWPCCYGNLGCSYEQTAGYFAQFLGFVTSLLMCSLHT